MTMGRFLTRLATACALLGAAPAYAQHSGHSMPMTAPPPASGMDTMRSTGMGAANPHAGHGAAPAQVPAAPAPADPHAGHQAMPMMSGQSMPHTGHTPPATQADPHAAHAMGSGTPMSGMQAGHAMGDPSPSVPEAPPPAAATSGPRHAADTVFDPQTMAGARETLRTEQGGLTAYKIMADRLEYRARDGRDGYLWDGQGWYGGDIDKLWIKTEGEGTVGSKLEDAEIQALWSRAITPWFDFQAGGRQDYRPDGPDRSYLVLGLQGLAPYFFELDTAAFVSQKGDVTARIEAEYDQLITQKLILQPRAEIELAAQDVPELGIGAGLSTFEAGLRLRYEFVPDFAPYIGVEYERKVGKTGRYARDEGEDAGSTSFLVGLRMWF